MWPFMIVLIWGLGIGLVVFSDFYFYAILGELNSKNPSDQQISMFFVNVKYFEVLKRHSELFPASRKRFHMQVCFATGVVIMVVGFVVGVLHYSRYS